MDNSPQNLSSTFIKDYGTLIIAVYGVIQLWLLGIFRWLFRRRRVDLYTAEVAEVGYSNFGPTLGLYGTITTIHKDSFISNISLVVIRERDRAQYNFNWLAFRSNQFTIGANSQISFELPSGFIITPTQPHRYNILFSDFQRYSEMLPAIRQIQDVWATEVRTALSISPLPNYATLFDNLARSGRAEIVDFHTRIQRLCYWEVGDYSVRIRIRTSNPQHDFLFSRRFSLSEEDVNRLRLNVISILAELCRQPNNLFNFAFPTLRE